MKHIVLFGDSLLAGTDEIWAVDLEKQIPSGVVYNCATSGFNTNDCLKRAPLIARMQADVVVISLGMNDAAPWKQVSLEIFKTNLDRMTEILKGSRLIFLLPPPINEARQPSDKNRSNHVISQYREAIRQTVHGRADFLNLDLDIDYHVDDGVHLNEAGYLALSDRLAKLIHA